MRLSQRCGVETRHCRASSESRRSPPCCSQVSILGSLPEPPAASNVLPEPPAASDNPPEPPAASNVLPEPPAASKQAHLPSRGLDDRDTVGRPCWGYLISGGHSQCNMSFSAAKARDVSRLKQPPPLPPVVVGAADGTAIQEVWWRRRWRARGRHWRRRHGGRGRRRVVSTARRTRARAAL